MHLMVQLSLNGTVDKQGSFNVAFLSCQQAISSENLVASTQLFVTLATSESQF